MLCPKPRWGGAATMQSPACLNNVGLSLHPKPRWGGAARYTKPSLPEQCGSLAPISSAVVHMFGSSASCTLRVADILSRQHTSSQGIHLWDSYGRQPTQHRSQTCGLCRAGSRVSDSLEHHAQGDQHSGHQQHSAAGRAAGKHMVHDMMLQFCHASALVSAAGLAIMHVDTLARGT